MSPPEPAELLNASQVADMLGMTKQWVYEQSRTGRIPTITLGRYRRYRRAAIERWLASIETTAVNGDHLRRDAVRALRVDETSRH